MGGGDEKKRKKERKGQAGTEDGKRDGGFGKTGDARPDWTKLVHLKVKHADFHKNSILNKIPLKSKPSQEVYKC